MLKPFLYLQLKQFQQKKTGRASSSSPVPSNGRQEGVNGTNGSPNVRGGLGEQPAARWHHKVAPQNIRYCTYHLPCTGKIAAPPPPPDSHIKVGVSLSRARLRLTRQSLNRVGHEGKPCLKGEQRHPPCPSKVPLS